MLFLMEPMKAVIYARVSSDPHGLGRSTADQVRDCELICKREGWEISRTLIDNNRGASRWASGTREAYAQLEELIRGSSVSVLVTWEASRAQRDLDTYVQMRDLCRNHDVLWSYSGRTYDLSRTDDAFTTGLDALLSEREASITRDRILRSVRSRAQQGKPHGKIPYGYRREYDSENGSLASQVPDEKTAPIVREICDRVDLGESLRSVARDLNERGIPTPRNGKAWVMQQVRRICLSPTYVGKRTHNGVVVGDAAWPPLVSEGQHLRLVSRLTDPARRTMKDGSVRHLLSGIAMCGACGAPLRVLPNRGRPSYLCHEKFCVARSKEKMDEFVEELVIARLSRDDVSLVSGASVALREQLEKIGELRARLDSFYDAAAAGELTPAALARIETRLLSEIEQLEAKVRPNIDAASLAAVAGPDARREWEARPLTTRRSIIKSLMTITVMPVGKGNRKFDSDAIKIEWH